MIIIGDDSQWPDTIKQPRFYFEQRHARLDLRGPLFIAKDTHWGQFVTVITKSHKFKNGELSLPLDRPVVVASGAWIGSRAILYNCIVGERSVVACGSVVRSCEIAPDVMVAGNPARVVARWDGEYWIWMEPKWRTLK